MTDHDSTSRLRPWKGDKVQLRGLTGTVLIPRGTDGLTCIRWDNSTEVTWHESATLTIIEQAPPTPVSPLPSPPPTTTATEYNPSPTFDVPIVLTVKDYGQTPGTAIYALQGIINCWTVSHPLTSLVRVTLQLPESSGNALKLAVDNLPPIVGNYVVGVPLKAEPPPPPPPILEIGDQVALSPARDAHDNLTGRSISDRGIGTVVELDEVDCNVKVYWPRKGLATWYPSNVLTL